MKTEKITWEEAIKNPLKMNLYQRIEDRKDNLKKIILAGVLTLASIGLFEYNNYTLNANNNYTQIELQKSEINKKLNNLENICSESVIQNNNIDYYQALNEINFEKGQLKELRKKEIPYIGKKMLKILGLLGIYLFGFGGVVGYKMVDSLVYKPEVEEARKRLKESLGVKKIR